MPRSILFAKAFASLSALMLVTACGDHSAHHSPEHKIAAERHEGIEVSAPWIRVAAPPAKTSAIYFTVKNTNTETDVLLSASSDLAEFVEIHQTSETDGVSQMRKLDQLSLESGSSVKFETGSYHVMLINLTAPIVEGELYPITLNFEKAGTMTVTAIARTGGSTGHEHH